jgi:hypothetical protein
MAAWLSAVKHCQTNYKILHGGLTRRLVPPHAAEASIRGLCIIEDGTVIACPTLHG